MRRRRRRRALRFGPDKRLWLYGRVPSHFWDDPEHRELYVVWLGEQLGFERPEDWYNVQARHFRRHRGSTLLGRFYGSPSAVVIGCGPRHRWEEWRFRTAPHGFWDKRANRRRYMDWLGLRLGFRHAEDWYCMTVQHFRSNYGRSILHKLGDSPAAILKEYLPDFDWQEWRFQSAPQRFWHDPRNRRRYMAWLAETLGFTTDEDWYAVKAEDFHKHHGAGLLAQVNDSPIAAVREYRPAVRWLEWRFASVPDGFWEDRRNRRRYLDWLGRQLGFTAWQAWYQVKTADFERHGGHRLLHRFGYSPIAVLKDYIPHAPWQEWRFASVPQRFWQNRQNRRRYMTWLAAELGFTEPADWYRITVRDFRAHYGNGLLQHFGNSPSAAVKDQLPNFPWLEWRFASAPNRFWTERANRRRYMNWLAGELGFRRLDDWYRVRIRDFEAHDGSSLLVHFAWSRLAILKDYRPDQRWNARRFASPPRSAASRRAR